MSAAQQSDLAFGSAEEFADLCDKIAARLHWMNRVGLGEQVFVAELAELIRKAGAALPAYQNDPEVRAMFGDGWTLGHLAREDRPAALLALIAGTRPG